MKIPMIEFALNSARSDTTGFTPFFLNYGRTPYPMVWSDIDPFPGVKTFAEKMKTAILGAHDAIIEARVRQTTAANRSRSAAPFKAGEFVYVSTKNITIPKQRARKLAPKYIGPLKIVKEIAPGSSYEVELPIDLKAKGVHPVFHASLLREHVPNDDRRFPGRQLEQFVGLNDNPEEWAIESIVDHSGSGANAMFKVRWKAGDESWCEYRAVSHLEPMKAYCEAYGVETALNLPERNAQHEELSAPIELMCINTGLEERRMDNNNLTNSPPPSPIQTFFETSSISSLTSTSMTPDLDGPQVLPIVPIQFLVHDVYRILCLMGRPPLIAAVPPPGYDNWSARNSAAEQVYSGLKYLDSHCHEQAEAAIPTHHPSQPVYSENTAYRLSLALLDQNARLMEAIVGDAFHARHESEQDAPPILSKSQRRNLKRKIKRARRCQGSSVSSFEHQGSSERPAHPTPPSSVTLTSTATSPSSVPAVTDDELFSDPVIVPQIGNVTNESPVPPPSYKQTRAGPRTSRDPVAVAPDCSTPVRPTGIWSFRQPPTSIATRAVGPQIVTEYSPTAPWANGLIDRRSHHELPPPSHPHRSSTMDPRLVSRDEVVEDPIVFLRARLPRGGQ